MPSFPSINFMIKRLKICSLLLMYLKFLSGVLYFLTIMFFFYRSRWDMVQSVWEKLDCIPDQSSRLFDNMAEFLAFRRVLVHVLVVDGILVENMQSKDKYDKTYSITFRSHSSYCPTSFQLQVCRLPEVLLIESVVPSYWSFP